MKYIFFLFCSIVLQAQNVEQIVNTHFESTGGKENWANLKSTIVTANLNVNGTLMKLKSYSKAPFKTKNEVSFNGQKSISVFDGLYAWKKDFNALPEYTNNEEYFDIKADSDFYSPLLNYQKNDFKIKLKKDKTIGNIPCFVVHLYKKNAEYTYYISKDKYRIIAEVLNIKGKKARMKYSNFKTVNGLLFPFKIEQKNADATLVGIELTNITINSELPDTIFEFAN